MKTENKIILFFFCACLLYLWSAVCIANGALRERLDSVCATPWQIEQWVKSIDTARTVYLNTADSRGQEIEKLRAEAQTWRDRYYLLKQQTDDKPDSEN